MRAEDCQVRCSIGLPVLFLTLVLLSAIAAPVLAAQPDPAVANASQDASTPHYIYDPETGAFIGYGTTPSPEEQEVIDRIRGPGYSPFPAPTPLAMDMAPEQPVYAYGEQVKINITFSNAIADSFTFPDFPPEIQISIRPDGWDRGIVRTIQQGCETRILEPYATTSTAIIWDQKNDLQVQVNPGVYYLTAQTGLIQGITPGSTTVLSSFIGAGSEVIVQYPQGALDGTLYPDIAVTDGDVTATLDAVTFNASGGTISMTVRAPEPSEGARSSPGFSQVTAGYRIDNGMAQNFRDTSSLYTGGGLHRITWKTGPVPCDAREIQIAVTKFDPYRGHWNFTVRCADIRTCAVDNETRFSRGSLPDTSPVKKSAATLPAPFSGIFTIAAFGIAGAISVMETRRR